MKPGDLATEIDAVLNVPWHVPAHAVWRLYVLVGDSEILYLDGTAIRDDDGLTGRVVAATADRICALELRSSRETDRFDDPRSTASARSWTRRSLIAVNIPVAADASVNPDDAWQDASGDLVPPRSRIEFRYRDGECLALPLAGEFATPQQRKRLSAFLPQLLQDLR